MSVVKMVLISRMRNMGSFIAYLDRAQLLENRTEGPCFLKSLAIGAITQDESRFLASQPRTGSESVGFYWVYIVLYSCAVYVPN